MQGDRAPRGELARLRCKGDRLATSSLTDPSQARVRRKVPGLFVFMRPAGGIGIRACLRSMSVRVRIPGGVPDFFARANALAPALLQLGCGKDPAARALDRSTARRGCAGSHRLTVRTGTPIPDLAVAQRPARVVRDDENAGSTPAGETTDSPVAQWHIERAPTKREVEGSNPSRGAKRGAVTQAKRVPACRAGSRGFKSRRRRQFFSGA